MFIRRRRRRRRRCRSNCHLCCLLCCAFFPLSCVLVCVCVPFYMEYANKHRHTQNVFECITQCTRHSSISKCLSEQTFLFSAFALSFSLCFSFCKLNSTFSIFKFTSILTFCVILFRFSECIFVFAIVIIRGICLSVGSFARVAVVLTHLRFRYDNNLFFFLLHPFRFTQSLTNGMNYSVQKRDQSIVVISLWPLSFHFTSFRFI